MMVLYYVFAAYFHMVSPGLAKLIMNKGSAFVAVVCDFGSCSV